MKKILIVSIQRADKTVGGMSYRFMALWEYLQKHPEVEVHLLCTKTLWDKVINKPLDNFSGKVSIMDDTNLYKLKVFFLWLRALMIILRKGIKSVHIAGGQYLFLPFYKASRLLGIKMIITFASNSIKMAAYNNPSAEKKWHLILKQVEEIDILNPTYNLPDYGFKVNVSPCSFPFHLYRNGELQEIPAIAQKKENLILFVGALSRTKNPILALEGFADFKRNHVNDYKLIIVGKGPLKDELEQLAVKYNEELGASFIELVDGLPSDEIYKLMQRSKIFLSLQDYDNYPSQSLMEAMIYENAIIATADGDTKALVKEEFGNIIISEKKASDLSKAIIQINGLNIRSQENRNFILKHFTLERFKQYFTRIHNLS